MCFLVVNYCVMMHVLFVGCCCFVTCVFVCGLCVFVRFGCDVLSVVVRFVFRAFVVCVCLHCCLMCLCVFVCDLLCVAARFAIR